MGFTLIGEPPVVSGRTAPYWQSGADGQLRLARCADCRHFIHPPRPLCPQCLSRRVAFEPVSGKGVVYSHTVNRYPWTERQREPYVIAEVDLVEQPGLRLVSNIVDCPVEDVRIGMNVEVTFEAASAAEGAEGVEGVWIPLFRPC